MGQLPSICEQVRAYAAASVDGELSQVEAARLESHLSTCASCRHFAADLGEIAFLVRSTPLESLDFPIVLPSTRLRLGRVFQVGAAAVAVVAVVGISATVGIGQRPNAQSTAWAVQGLLAAGRDPASVRRHGSRSPLAYLQSLTGPDGSVHYSRTSAQTPVWVTAQALIALARRTFPV